MQTQETSQAAYNSIQGHPANSLRGQIYGAIYRAGNRGLTCDEIEKATKIKHQTASARIRELRDDNMIVDSGYRRNTRSGRAAAVYITINQ